MHNFLNEFKKFIARGSVLDLAVGLAVGMAFQKIITSLVSDIILPAISPLISKVNFTEWKMGPMLVGNFINNCIDFIIISFFIFLVVRFANKFKKAEEDLKARELSIEEREEQLLIEIRDLLKKQ